MFVVPNGGVDVLLPTLTGASRVFAHHRKHDFSGEFSLLNSQRAVTEASNRRTGEKTRKAIGRVFVMIGAEPNSCWLYGTV